MRLRLKLFTAVAALCLATSAQAQTPLHFTLKSVDQSKCKGGLHFGYPAQAAMHIGCLMKGFAQIDLDSSDAGAQLATVYDYHPTPDVLAAWQADPKSALGRSNGFSPIHMDNVSVTLDEKGWKFSGAWVTSNGEVSKTENLTIELYSYKNTLAIAGVTRP